MKLTRKKKISESDIVLIKNYLEEEKNVYQIRELTGWPYNRISWIIKSNNFLVKNKNRIYTVNNNYFEKIDTEEKAYLLGFIIADGCISINIRKNSISKRLEFLNSIDDKEVIELVRNQISHDSKIYVRNNQSGVKKRKEQLCLRIISTEICDTLINKYKVLPNKTLDSSFSFNFELIPKDLHRHFIRGFFDGDGSVSCYEINNTIGFDFSFVFTSEAFTNQVSDIFTDLCDIKSVIYKKEGKTTDYYLLRFDYKRDKLPRIRKIYDYLYSDSKHFLNRKKVKFDQYFQYRANSSSKQWKVV